MAGPRVGEILVADGACAPEQVREALQNQVIFGGRLGTNLLELGSVAEEALARALARRHGVPSLCGDVALDPRALAVVRPEIAERWDVVPYLLADRKLAVLACDPSNLAMLDEIAFATGLRVHAFVVPEARVWALLRRAYGVERQLRGIEVDFAQPARGSPAAGAAPAPAPATTGPDLMDEGEFDALYGSVGQGARAATAAASPSAAGSAPPPLTPAPSARSDAGEGGRDEILGALARAGGHAPPVRLAAIAAPRAPEAEPSPLGFAEAVRFLEGVSERDAIARTVLRYARSKFRRAVLLTVHRGVAQGWAGLGENLTRETVPRMRLPLGAPGIVDTVVSTRAHYLGPIPKTEANVRLLKLLGGGVPGNAFLVPILALGRVVNVFYADAGRGAMVDASGVGELLILATRIAQSYDALVARAV
jgi:hypothetical protein